MPKFSVQKPFTVVVGVIMLLVLGFVSFTRMTTDLLPAMSLPYVVVVTSYPGASPERVESGVTQLLESSLGTVNGVENVTSTSSENFSMVVLEFEEDTNMDSAMVKLSTAIDQLTLPETVGTPMLLEISPDMMATMMVSVSRENMDIYGLTQFVQDEVTPYLERQSGVASVEGSGLVEKSVEIRLVQEKIDDINRKLSSKVTAAMDDAEQELKDARAEIDDAKEELESGKKELASQQDSTTSQLAETSLLLDQALATQSAYSAQVSGLEASKMALEMEQKAYSDHQIAENYENINKAFRELIASTTPGSEQYDQTYSAMYAQVYPMVQDQIYRSLLAVEVQGLKWVSDQTLPELPPMPGEQTTQSQGEGKTEATQPLETAAAEESTPVSTAPAETQPESIPVSEAPAETLPESDSVLINPAQAQEDLTQANPTEKNKETNTAALDEIQETGQVSGAPAAAKPAKTELAFSGRILPAALEGEITAENAEEMLLAAVEQGIVTAEQAETIRSQTKAAADAAAPALARQTVTEQIAAMREGLPADVEDALAHPEKLESVKAMLQAAGQGEMASMLSTDALSQLHEIAGVRIPQIETELANLEIEIQTAKMVLDQVNQSVQQAVDGYTQLEAGKITAAVTFGTMSAQMISGESALESALAQLKEGETALKNARETALENANLDALLNMNTLSQMIYAQNFSMPAGYIYEGENQYLLKVGDEFASIEELKDALLCQIDDIGDIRLRDVAYVTMIDNAGESYARMNGSDAILLSIYKSSTAGTSDVSKACNQAIAELEERYEGLEITPLMDQGDYIKLIVNEVMSNLIWGALLAILVLALFLKDVKPTVVVAFSIPISVLFAVVLMFFSNITLNIISLSGLALGVGMLVDNSIVVIENIYRLRSQGVPAARAAVKGANQVAGAIFASTLTTVCVFLPIVFTEGLTRQLFTDMALTIGYSLGASLIVALTVVPSMGATVLKNCREKTHPLFDRIMAVYEKSLRFCLKVKLVPLTVSIALLLFSVWQVTQMGLILIPEMGGNQMSVSVSAPEGTSDEEAYVLADRVMSRFAALEGVETVGAMSGAGMMSMMGGGGGSTGGPVSFSFYVLLDEEASQDNKQLAVQMEQILLEEGAEGSVSTSNMDMSSLMASGLQIDIYGNDLDTMLAVSEDMMALLDQVQGFTDITNGQEDGDSEIRVVVDKDKAMGIGLTVAQIYSQLASSLTTEKTSTTLRMDGQEYPVIIVDTTDEVTLSNLMEQEFETTSQNEEGVSETEVHTLAEFAREEEGKGLVSIRRDNQARYLSVSAVTEDGYNTTLLARQVEQLLAGYEVPAGCSVSIAGESTAVMDSMRDMLLMIALAVVFIYLIMVAQFQSILSPFIVLFTIPLAFTGGLLAILLSKEPLSLIAMMGFLVLAGVVVNNGIVFVDYVNQLRLDGAPKREALVETGMTRMRPILMTAMTTILAMFTMAFSKSAAASMGKGMAVVTIGGLAYATFMTLYIVPVLYDLFFRRELKKVDRGEEETLQEP